MTRQQPEAGNQDTEGAQPAGGRMARALDWVERVGNKLPDPALLFFLLLLLVWVVSALLSQFSFNQIDPRTGEAIEIRNLLSGQALTAFTSNMVSTFVNFHPLGVVLLAMLGIGVADYTGFIRAGLRALLSLTSQRLLTPLLLLVALISSTAVDAGYVLVIPLGAVIFQAAGRHPLAGIAAAFAGVSGGFSANFIPSAVDPMLQGISQEAARLLDPSIELNALNNWFFTSASTIWIILIGWYLTDRVVEPRLTHTPVDGDLADSPRMAPLTAVERRGLILALLSVVAGIVVLALTSLPAGSAWRGADGTLAESGAPLMSSIVPLIFLLFVLPGVVYGYATGSVRTHRDIIEGMSQAMSGMGYYIVMAFFAALFISEFGRSNLGVLVALQGATGLQALALPAGLTVVAVILITGVVNLFVGSASAKWALLAPILVPMLMQLGISPDLTQAAYRVGDSATNIVTPLMPYFPLVVVFCQRYVRSTGIGTVVAMMLPYSVVFLLFWALFLLLYWMTGLPLGLQSSYSY